METKVSSKGQVVLPSRLRAKLGLRAGDALEVKLEGDAIVLRPTIPNGGGIFAEKAEARLWLSDDRDRIVLGIQSKFSFGHMTLKLKEYSVPGHL